MVVSIHISSFSLKVLVKDEGFPLRLGAGNGVLRALLTDIGVRADDSRLALLDREVEVDINSKYMSAIRRVGVGVHLHNYHLDQMMRFVYAAVLTSVDENASKYIKMFYEMYDISIDDFDLEAAFRRWQRFYAKKKALKTSITSIDMVSQKKRLLSEDEMESVLSRLVTAFPDDFLRLDYGFKKSYLKQVRVMLYHMHGYHIVRISNMFGYPMVTVYKIVSKMRDQFAQYNYNSYIESLRLTA